MVRTHLPGEAVFRSILPEDIDWKPFAAFPPSVRLAVLVGQPSERGPYVIRVKAPAGVKGPVAIYVGIDWRVFGRHEAIRSCGEVNDLIVWFLGEGLPSVDLAHGDLS
jgi:hypothetical protein